MVNLPPSLVSGAFFRLAKVKLRFPNFKLKFKLGVLLLCLTFLLDYQPTLGFPPVKRNVVFAEITQEQTVASQEAAVVFQLPYPGYITTRFSAGHPGIDYCSGLGMPIKPLAKGKVVEAGYNFFGFGLMVEIEHPSGYRSLYAHMGKIFVQKGQEVSENEFIGEIGMTGNTSGPHSHIELSKDGQKIDPLLVLPEIRKYPTESDFAVITSATPSAVTIPAASPIASESARPITSSAPVTQAVEAVKTEAENLLSKTEAKVEEKIDLPKQNVQNILNLASPRPSTAPVPQGGKLSMRNFSLFGFSK